MSSGKFVEFRQNLCFPINYLLGAQRNAVYKQKFVRRRFMCFLYFDSKKSWEFVSSGKWHPYKSVTEYVNYHMLLIIFVNQLYY